MPEAILRRPFRVLRASSWEVARAITSRLYGWAYRGHKRSDWRLVTTIERAADLYGFPKDRLRNREQWIVTQFQRRAHHYMDNLPDPEAVFDWLALIQHYGGPTRLLDFSYSFYLASFFALETAEADAVLWGIHLNSLQTGIGDPSEAPSHNRLKINELYVQRANKILRGELEAVGVLPVEPFQLHERLSIQRGLFLFPCDLEAGFLANLARQLGIDLDKEPPREDCRDTSATVVDPEHTKILKIIIPRTTHNTALWDLDEMNINAASLFPGLDGYARYLHYFIRRPLVDQDFHRKFGFDEIEEGHAGS